MSITEDCNYKHSLFLMNELSQPFTGVATCRPAKQKEYPKCNRKWRPMWWKVPNRFKYRHNGTFTILVFIFFCNSKSFKSCQNAPFTILVCIFTATPNRSNPVTMHNLPSLFSKTSAVLTRFKSRHDACLSYIAFIYFSAVPNRLKYHQHACFRDIV